MLDAQLKLSKHFSKVYVLALLLCKNASAINKTSVRGLKFDSQQQG